MADVARKVQDTPKGNVNSGGLITEGQSINDIVTALNGANYQDCGALNRDLNFKKDLILVNGVIKNGKVKQG